MGAGEGDLPGYPIELELHPVADLRIMEIAEDVHGFDGSGCDC